MYKLTTRSIQSRLLYSRNIKYFIYPHTTLLLRILSTCHFFSLFISTSFCFFTFCFLTSFLYLTALLMFTIEWILTEISSLRLTILANTIFSMVYSLAYYSVSFLAGLSLNTKFLILSTTLSLFTIDCKSCHSKLFKPVFLFIVYNEYQILLQLLVYSSYLSICLKIKYC